MASKIYDSGDPNRPNLPQLDLLDDSSAEEYNFSEDDSSELTSSSSSDDDTELGDDGSYREKANTMHNARRVAFFGVDDSTQHSFNVAHKLSTIQDDIAELLLLADPESVPHLRRRKLRKYYDSSMSASSLRLRANWEPGITPSTKVSLHSVGSAITVTDYNESRYRVEHLEVPTMDSDGEKKSKQDRDHQFEDLHDDPMTKLQVQQANKATKIKKLIDRLDAILKERPSWAKVRWVNVNGLSWELISVVSQHFQLHRLSIEDMIDIPQRTKVDQYSNYTMCILPLVKLVKMKKHNSVSSTSSLAANKDHHSHHSHRKSITQQIADRQMRRVYDWSSEITSRRKVKLLEVHRPLSYRNLTVGIEQVSLFIMNGTVISFFENSAGDIESSILNRLTTGETILRDSCDTSILLQSIIDSVVDLLYPIVTAYRRRLEEVQLDILTDLKISNVHELYLMLDELSLLKKNISPITTLVNALKDHAKKSESNSNSNSNLKEGDRQISTTSLRPIFISPNCEMYLSDVLDHTQSYTEDIAIMETMVNNLASIVFNMTATQQNNSMSYMSLVSVIFLPLMFWSSYYGMNFKQFGDLDHSVSYYWKVSITFTAVFIILVCWNYFIRFCKSWYKVAKRWRREFRMYMRLRRRKRVKRQERKLREAKRKSVV